MNKINISPYNPEWPKIFQKEKELLEKVLPSNLKIEHIGSTSIKGISTKPIIDILIGAPNLDENEANDIIEILESVGHEHAAEYSKLTPRRFYFSKEVDGKRLFQAHLVELSSDWWKNFILFRDFLKSNPDYASKYQELKLELAAQASNIDEYTKSKTEFVNKVIELAKKQNS